MQSALVEQKKRQIIVQHLGVWRTALNPMPNLGMTTNEATMQLPILSFWA